MFASSRTGVDSPRMSAAPRTTTAAATEHPRREARTVAGNVRLGRRTKLMVKRLAPGEIAIIDHKDLDRVSAEDLVAAGVAAVLNCRRSSSGTYPNMGPLLLVQAGIHLVDLPDDRVFDQLKDGDRVEVRGGEVWRDGDLLISGAVQHPDDVRARNDGAPPDTV